MRRFLLVAAVLAVVPVVVAARGGDTAVRAGSPPTYYADVAPILNGRCAGCHMPGGVAPFSLTSAKDAQRYARAIAAIVKAGTMPPWPPARDSAAFVGQSARVLGDEEKQTLAAWADAGAPAGAKRSLPKPEPAPLPRGSRVVQLAPPKPYVPRATGGFDDYHCFVLDPKLARATYVTGALIKPSAASLVHHVILFEATGPQAAAATRLDRRSGGKGWTCFGGPGLPSDFNAAGASSLRFGSPQWLAAWVPGHVTNTLPDGLGVLLHKNSKIVMQVHYNLLHGAKPDRSTAVLTTAPAGSRLKPLETMLVAAPVELPCPRPAAGPPCTRAAAIAEVTQKYGPQGAFVSAGLLALCRKVLADFPKDVGEGRSIGTDCDRSITQPLTLHGVAGHMHLRGRDISLVLNPGTPKERTLLHIPRWDFRWQDVYFLKQPIELAPGDTVRISCRFDNSTDAQPLVGGAALAPRYVIWGEGTTDEMCLGVLSVAIR